MAKLKVQASLANLDPSENGYVAIVDNLFLSSTGVYQDFVDAEPDERVDYLKAAAMLPNVVPGLPATKFYVTQLEVDANNVDVAVEITNKICRILGEKDIRRKPLGKRSKFTIPIPDKQPENLDYLQKYAEIIHNLYKSAAAAPTAAEAKAFRDKAHKFMFGVMMLTRCR